MDYKQLFETQLKLDYRIKKEKDLHGVPLTENKILALLVEIGEMTNELPEEFKHWSNKKNKLDKALEEHVDILHFLLSIGNDIGYTTYTALKPTNEKTTIQKQILELYDFTAIFMNSLTFDEHVAHDPYQELFNRFLNLGRLLGFSNETIEEAYYNKNKTNHDRQDNGY